MNRERDHKHDSGLGEIMGLLAVINRKQDLIMQMLKQEEIHMSKADDAIAKLQADVTNLTTVDQSAVALLNGIQQRIDDAIAAAQAAGATDAQLKALSDLSDAIEASNTGLAAAVTANTPAAPAS